MANKQTQRVQEIWQDKLSSFLVKGRVTRALDYLADVIDAPPSLFEDDPTFVDERRLAWLLRINLLMQFHRYREALAWVLYELELHPDRPVVLAMRARLRRILNLDAAKSESDAASDKAYEWSTVAGMRNVKAMLEHDVLLPLIEPELFEKYGLDVPGGILFYGPPGCGKTHIARALAEMAGRTFLEIKPSELGSTYVHGSQLKIRELFNKARKQAPCLMFLDELDALAPERGKSGGHYDREVNELLVQLDDCVKDEILVVGATNQFGKIDAAIKRSGRMDKKVFIGLPDIEARAELVSLSLAKRPTSRIDAAEIAGALEGYTAAEVIQVCDEAARLALSKRRDITELDLHRSIREFKPQRFSNNPADWE